jgi:predicted RNA binding protein YcfA (HicA-like mRNA interferase family)
VQKLVPVSSDELIKRLSQFGFKGPFGGGKHLYMLKGAMRLTIPNPHRGDIGIELLARVLRLAEISKVDWLSLQ